VITKLTITEEMVRAQVDADVFTRGVDYCRTGAVSGLVRRGAELTADVHGSEFAPYQVVIHLHDDGVAGANCTCPYDWGGYCKHIVAVLLASIRNPGSIMERRPIPDVLRGLEHEALLNLFLKRLQSDDALTRWIEAELAVVSPDEEAAAGQQRPAVDSAPIRQQARLLLSGRYRRQRYWDDYRASGDNKELQRLVEKAVPFLEAGDGPNALRVLEPIAESFIEDWLQYCDHDEDMHLIFADLGRLIAEAALMSDLPPKDRSILTAELCRWQGRIDEYGVDEGFEVAIRALKSGWDEPGLREVMAGEAQSWPLEGDVEANDETANQLTAVRLRVLEACGQHEEYLNLSRAAGCFASYAVQLARLDRIADAMDFALTSFRSPDEALSLAKTLREVNAHEEALRIAEAGLGFGENPETTPHGDTSALAHWLRDYAAGLGRSELALTAGCAAFAHTLSLEDFQAVRNLAGERWPEIRPGLLEPLARAPYAYDRIKIYLSEGMIDTAVRSIGERLDVGYYDGPLIELAEAAHASHSAWVIRLARAQADNIMDANKSQHYETAARWLQTAGRAYRASGKADEWDTEVTSLIAKHRRKPKLRPLLEELMKAKP
jgi:uncharacterized Zn finger protein